VRIENQLDKIFQNINPPQSSVEFREEMMKVGKHCKDILVDTVRLHLQRQARETERKIVEHSGMDFVVAATWAKDKIRRNYRHKISMEETDQWLSGARDMMPEESMAPDIQPPTSENGATVSTEVSDFITVLGSPRRRAAQKRDRLEEDSSSLEDENRFSKLPQEEDLGKEDSPHSQPSRTPKKIKRQQKVSVYTKGQRELEIPEETNEPSNNSENLSLRATGAQSQTSREESEPSNNSENLSLRATGAQSQTSREKTDAYGFIDEEDSIEEDERERRDKEFEQEDFIERMEALYERLTGDLTDEEVEYSLGETNTPTDPLSFASRRLNSNPKSEVGKTDTCGVNNGWGPRWKPTKKNSKKNSKKKFWK
jgi:hypothetical protein